MFIQVIQGRVTDAGEMRQALDQWVRDVSPQATGWLGTTAGVTEDGQFIALVRFESAEAARTNSDRAEQDQWWAQTSKLFAEEPRFRDSTEVVLDVAGDPDAARFVQVMQGRISDPQRAKELWQQDAEKWAAFRPDMLASVQAEHGGGDYTMALYFTSEEDAREGEKKETPDELKPQMAEMDSLNVGMPSFFDLKDPWLHSAG